MSETEDKKFQSLLQAALQRARHENGTKNSLAMLFPNLERAAQTYIPTHSHINERRQKRRVSVPDFAENYFALSPHYDTWGHDDFQRVIGGQANEAFRALDARINSAPADSRSDLRRIFLELLDAEFSTHKKLNEDWLLAIIDASPSLVAAKDEEAKSFFYFSNADRLRWLIQHGLEALPIENRVSLLKGAIEKASDLSILADTIRGLIGDSNPEGATRDSNRVDFGDQANVIRELLLSRIQKLAQDGIIWKQASPQQLLWFWWGSSSDSELRAFTAKAMANRSNTLSLMRAMLGLVRSSSEGDFLRVSPHWAKMVDLDSLSVEASKIAAGGSDAEKAAANEFLIALKRGRESHF